MRPLARVVGIFIVDSRGWVLLQERDEHAHISPNQWACVGGHIDGGEDWAAGRDRELLEETGLVLPVGTLELFFEGEVWHPEVEILHQWQVWVGRADLGDDDIVCGEGRRIVFVHPGTAYDLDLGVSTRHFLPKFLGSDAYARLVAGVA